MINIMVLSLFDFSQKIKNEFLKNGLACESLDIAKSSIYDCPDHTLDFIDFDYKQYPKGSVTHVFCAFPCHTFSIASGGFHFKNGKPITPSAIKAINMLIKLKQLVAYHNCYLVIENPSGGLVNNPIFNSLFDLSVSRLYLGAFGFVTYKRTDIFSNFPFLLLNNPLHRVRGRYQAQSLDNLTKSKRSIYPSGFVRYIVTNYLAQTSCL